MKKTFRLKVEGKNQDRLLDKIKYEIRKYIKREKNKPKPEEVDFWKFECKFGKNDEEPQVIEFVDITKNIDEAAALDCDSFYMEILSTEGVRVKKEKIEESAEENSEEKIEENTEPENNEEL